MAPFRHVASFLKRRPGAATAVALFILYFGVVALKLHHWPPTAPLQSDPAFRLRYVGIYAAGESPPRPDVFAQWPEGLDPARADFLTQDAFIGVTLYWFNRLTKADVAPPVWLRWQVSAWSSLSVFIVYLWGRALFPTRRGALLAALAYALALPIYIRTCGNYLREDFVLPLFFLGLFALLRTLRGARGVWPAVSGAAFFVTLLSWHASSFLMFFAALITALAVIITDRPKDAVVATATLVIACVAAFAVHPALRQKAFLASPAAALAAGALAASILAVAKKRPTAWWFRAAVVMAAAGAVFVATRPLAAAGEYSHIYTMIWYKIRFWGAKPADPTRLPLAAREIWSGPANSPSLAAAAVQFAGLALMAAPVWFLYGRRWREVWRSADTLAIGTAAALLLFAGLFAIYQRFAVVWVFFVALGVAGYGTFAAGARRWLWLIPAVLLPLEGIKAAAYEFRPWPWRPLLTAAAAAGKEGYAVAVGDEQGRLVRWFAAQRDENGAVIAPIADAAVLLTYARTPVVLHPIYEAPGMRARVHEVWSALYRSEEDFYAVCRKYEASYVAYNAAFVSNNNLESTRYVEAVTRVPVTSCAYRMQFQPRSLRHFAPVFETLTWRVFVVGVPGDQGPDLGPPSPLFSSPRTRQGYYDDAHGVIAYDAIEEAVAVYNAGVAAYEAGDYGLARTRFTAAVNACPRLNGAWDALAWLELEARRPAAAAYAASVALRLDPYDDAALAVMANLQRRR